MTKNKSLATALQDVAAPHQPPPKALPRAVGTRVISGHFPAAAHRQLRVLAAQEGRTVHDVLKEALNNLFAGRGLPPIA